MKSTDKDYQKRYRDSHKQERREYDKKYYKDRRQKKLDYYNTHKEERKEYRKSRSRYYRSIVLEHYGNKCECCGESNYEFLAIDHINGGGNKHRKQISGGKSASGNEICVWLVRNKFPEGFRILCHNCNQSIGFYGYCPHQEDKA